MENGMEAHVFEVRDAFGLAQIMPVTFAKRQDGASRTKHFFPEVREGMRGRVGVDLDGF